MLIRTVRTLVLGVLVTAAAAIPAAAQEPVKEVSAAASNLGDYGGWGGQFAYASQIRELAAAKILSWVADVSIHKNSVGSGVVEVNLTSLLAQAGVQVSGRAGEKARWYGHGLVGIVRASGSNDLTDALCEEFDLDCDASETNVIVTPGGGLVYEMNEKTGVFGQLDLPIGSGGSTTRFSVGVRFKLGN